MTTRLTRPDTAGVRRTSDGSVTVTPVFEPSVRGGSVTRPSRYIVRENGEMVSEDGTLGLARETVDWVMKRRSA